MDVSLSVVCSQEEVSSTKGRSLVQRGPSDCVVSECDPKAPLMSRPWLARGFSTMGGIMSMWSFYSNERLSFLDCVFIKPVLCFLLNQHLPHRSHSHILWLVFLPERLHNRYNLKASDEFGYLYPQSCSCFSGKQTIRKLNGWEFVGKTAKNMCLCKLFVSYLFSPMLRQPLMGQGLCKVEASRSPSDTPHSIRLLWKGDQPDAETCTWQHTIFIRDRPPCTQWDSNLHSQQTNGRKPTRFTSRTLESAAVSWYNILLILKRIS